MRRPECLCVHGRVISAGLLATALILDGPAFAADPIMTRNRNPLLTGFGIALPLPSRLGEERDTWVTAQLDWSSTATIQPAEREELVVDAETRTFDLIAQHRFGNGIALRVTIPWIYHGAGVLDSFIERWHDVFGLPQGSRRRLPHDQVLIGYARDEEILFLRRDGVDGLGDISLDAGATLYESARAALGAWLTVKLPTADASDLLGSGAVDAGVTVTADLALSDTWSLYGQLSYTYLGEGAFLPELQRRDIWRGLAGVAWQIARPVTVKAQIDAYTAAFERTELEFLGESALVTVGVDWEPSDRWRASFAVGEDLDVKASPDVVFHFALRRAF